MHSAERQRFHEPPFWDGLAFGLRWWLAIIHALFALPFLIRPLPELYQTFSAFDDAFPSIYWGWWSLLAAALLILMPTRVPLGLISTAFSTYQMFVISLTFSEGGGLIPGTTVYSVGFGGIGLLLFMRSLWLYMVNVAWFQRLMTWRTRRGGR